MEGKDTQRDTVLFPSSHKSKHCSQNPCISPSACPTGWEKRKNRPWGRERSGRETLGLNMFKVNFRALPGIRGMTQSPRVTSMTTEGQDF